MTEAKSKRNGMHFAYPSFTAFLREKVKERTTLKELVKIYESETGKRRTVRNWQIQAKQAAKKGFIRLERHEQFYASPPATSEMNPMISRPHHRTSSDEKRNGNHRIHQAHKIVFSTTFDGEQPTDGIIKPWGRYGTSLQVYYRLTGSVTAAVFKHAIKVWVRNPPGGLTKEQAMEARLMAFRALQGFAHGHDIRLTGYIDSPISSHHVVVEPALNDALKPLLAVYGDEIEARIGTKICPSSHKGNVEHEGRDRPDRNIRGDQVSIGLEYLTLDSPKRLESIGVEVEALRQEIRLVYGQNRVIAEAVIKLLKEERK